MDKHIKIHIIYIFGILISIIIGLITIKWGNVPNLVELFSFALTISSILLAILAIAYAVYSNTSFGQNISKLDTASNEIANSTKYLEEISNDLKNKFNNIPSLLETLNEKTDSNQAILTELSRNNSELYQTPFIKYSAIEEDTIKKVVKNTSINGQYILYILKLAKDSNKEFTPQEIENNSDLNKDFIAGFITPLQSLGLIKLETRMKNSDIYWTVEDIHSDIYENTPEAIIELWNKYREQEHMEFILDGINDIRKFFGLSEIPKDININKKHL